MESIEVWMWVIAGLLATGLILIVALTMISSYVTSIEKSEAKNTFSTINSHLNQACASGRNYQESFMTSFPSIVRYFNQSGPNKLCFSFSDQEEEPYCNSLERCSIIMNPPSIDIGKPTSFFGFFQKALGSRQSYKFKAHILKTDYTTIELNLTAQYTE